MVMLTSPLGPSLQTQGEDLSKEEWAQILIGPGLTRSQFEKIWKADRSRWLRERWILKAHSRHYGHLYAPGITMTDLLKQGKVIRGEAAQQYIRSMREELVDELLFGEYGVDDWHRLLAATGVDEDLLCYLGYCCSDIGEAHRKSRHLLSTVGIRLDHVFSLLEENHPVFDLPEYRHVEEPWRSIKSYLLQITQMIEGALRRERAYKEISNLTNLSTNVLKRMSNKQLRTLVKEAREEELARVLDENRANFYQEALDWLYPGLRSRWQLLVWHVLYQHRNRNIPELTENNRAIYRIMDTIIAARSTDHHKVDRTEQPESTQRVPREPKVTQNNVVQTAFRVVMTTLLQTLLGAIGLVLTLVCPFAMAYGSLYERPIIMWAGAVPMLLFCLVGASIVLLDDYRSSRLSKY